MQAELKDFWLFPFDQADASWLSGRGDGEREYLRHPRVRGRVNLALMKFFGLEIAFRPIADPFLARVALLDRAATRRLAWLAALCLSRRLLQQAIDRERREWISEVLGNDTTFLARRATLIWREEEQGNLPAVSCAAGLKEFLEMRGRGALASVLQTAAEPDVAARIMIRFPVSQDRQDALRNVGHSLVLRRLFEKLIDL